MSSSLAKAWSTFLSFPVRTTWRGIAPEGSLAASVRIAPLLVLFISVLGFKSTANSMTYVLRGFKALRAIGRQLGTFKEIHSTEIPSRLGKRVLTGERTRKIRGKVLKMGKRGKNIHKQLGPNYELHVYMRLLTGQLGQILTLRFKRGKLNFQKEENHDR